MEEKHRKELKKKRMIIGLLLLIIVIGVGYAALGANLQINGVTQIYGGSWNVRFKTGSINVTNGSVTIDPNNNQKAATIDSATEVSYAVKLALPGDFYEFTVVAENTGSIDAMIDSISSKLGNTEITTGALPSFLKYSVTYGDGVAISPNQLLAAGTEEIFKVRLEYDKEVDEENLPDENLTLNLNFQVNYVQADDTAVKVIPDPVSFATDSWYTIVKAVRDGNTDLYEVGDTKEIDMGTFGTHTLRISNMSTPSECSSDDFSQTACGFVLEFADIITTRAMNNISSNSGGWPATNMRVYLNTDIYNALPAELKNAVIDTKVLSNRTMYETSIFISTDKLYLLSSREVGYTNDFDVEGVRILDYYETNNTNEARNKINGCWWLRSGYYNDGISFRVSCVGSIGLSDATILQSVSPAFRLG